MCGCDLSTLRLTAIWRNLAKFDRYRNIAICKLVKINDLVDAEGIEPSTCRLREQQLTQYQRLTRNGWHLKKRKGRFGNDQKSVLWGYVGELRSRIDDKTSTSLHRIFTELSVEIEA